MPRPRHALLQQHWPHLDAIIHDKRLPEETRRFLKMPQASEAMQLTPYFKPRTTAATTVNPR